MQSHLILNLPHTLITILSTGPFPSFCTLILQNASAKLYTIKEGFILLQSFRHYNAHFDFFECMINKETIAELVVSDSCFLLAILLNGKSALHDQKGKLVSETLGNSCTLAHIGAGNFNWILKKGKHKLLLVTFRPMWLMQKTANYPELAGLTENYLSSNFPYRVLSHCALAKELFKEFEHSSFGIDPLHYSDQPQVYVFIDNCINRYHKHLLNGKFDLNTMYKIKVLKIAQYIELNLAEDLLNNTGSLAKKFDLSKRSILRYFKHAMQLSLHDYVIRVRMMKAMYLLETTRLPIKEITLKVGYQDPNYFSTSFKKFHGLNPSEVLRPL